MSASFTELNSGATLILNKTDIQEAFNLEEFCQLIMIDGTVYDLADNWSYVLSQISGGPTGP
jgi:hypothetical protein